VYHKLSPSDLCLHGPGTSDELDFQTLDTVKLVIFGPTNGGGDVLVLEKDSQDTWKQMSVVQM